MQERAANYERLQAEGDEFGLMFHLRSELMRRQMAVHSRDNEASLVRDRGARAQIARYQQAVCRALQYVGSGEAEHSLPAAQRLAFINETRHAFGRTALLLSGGAKTGLKCRRPYAVVPV